MRRILAEQVEPGDVIDWSGRAALVRAVRPPDKPLKRRAVLLDLMVEDVGNRDGAHYWADELIAFWDQT